MSAPEQVFLPIANWQPKESPVLEDDIGPLVQHIYEVEKASLVIVHLLNLIYDCVPFFR